MLFRWLLPVLFSLACLGTAVHADEKPHSVGFVNVRWILSNSPQVKAIEQSLKTEYETREADIEVEREKLKELESRLAQKGDSLQLDERSALERQIITERRRVKQLGDELDEDITFRKNEEMNKLRLQIAEVIEAIAKEQSIDMIFETAVVYVSDRVDISKQILDRLQKAYDQNNVRPKDQ